jgi:hypothetical protein
MMNPSKKLVGHCAMAMGVATALVICCVVPTGESLAGQDPVQKTEKVETKVITVETKDAQKDVPQKVEAEGVVQEVQVKQAVQKVEVKKVEQKVEVKAAVKVQGKLEGKVVEAAKVQVAGAADANAEAMAAQFIGVLRPILEAEMRMLTTVAEPSPAQRREIALEGCVALKKAATKLGEFQGRMNMGRAGVNNIDPRKIILDAVEASAKEKLPPEKFDRYKAELIARENEYKDALVLHLVADLDKLLVLTTDQREKLRETLNGHWDETNFPTIETATMYDGYYPIIANQYLNPILDDDQKKVWNTATKLSYASIRNFNFINNGQQPAVGESDDEDIKAGLAGGVK